MGRAIRLLIPSRLDDSYNYLISARYTASANPSAARINATASAITEGRPDIFAAIKLAD